MVAIYYLWVSVVTIFTYLDLRMKLKQRLVLVVVISVIFTVLFLMGVLLDWDDDVEPAPSPRPSVVQELHSQQKLPHHSTNVSRVPNTTVEERVPVKVPSNDPWSVWRGWVTADYLYPEDSFNSDEMNSVLAAMAHSRITSWGVGHKGTQLKVTAMLGNQRTVFKPKR